MHRPSVWVRGVLLFLPLSAFASPVLAPVISLAGVSLSLLYVGTFVRVLFEGMVAVPSPIPVLHQPVGVATDNEETAWRQYFFGQALADLRGTLKEARDRLLGQTRQVRRRIERGPLDNTSGFTQMVGALLSVIFVLAVCTAAFVTAAVMVFYVAMVLLLQAGARVMIAVLRTVDSALLRLRRIRMTCPSCYERVPYPSYDCPSCARRHRDVRPGRYGVFRRVCYCTQRMPTLLLLGSHQHDAFCPYCKNSLARRAGTAAEFVLPFFGAGNAGKTRLMLALVSALQHAAGRSGAEVEFADADTEQRVAALLPTIRRDRDTTITITSLPRAYSIHVAPRKGAPRFLHLFDAAGERFNTSEAVQDLRYMKAARSFVFVLDPLSVDAFWEKELAEHERRRLAPRRAMTRSPEFVFQQTLQNVEAMGVVTKQSRLAIVISKADLIRDVSTVSEMGNDSDHLTAWLAGVGLGNLRRSVQHAFADSRFFLTEAVVNDDGEVDDSVHSLLEWLFERERIRL